MTRGATIGLLVFLWQAPGTLGAPPAAELEPTAGYQLVAQLMSEERKERKQAARELIDSGDLSLVPAMVDALFFVPRQDRSELLMVLETLTGEELSGYREWVTYLGGREEIAPKSRYPEWKALLLARIDADYQKIIYPGAPARIRLEEVVWGGVPVDGIPVLDHPPTVPAEDAKYLQAKEKIFGVVLGGQARAYPLRILDWHELLNDEVGGQPIALSYCTLCGSGIVYATDTPTGGVYLFGTSGLLYRSNKLMFDRSTLTLWSNLTGEPVVGRLAGSPIRLPVLPVTLTTWQEWRQLHPETEVLDLESIRRQNKGRYNFDYRPGAADRARAGVSFPVWLESDAVDEDTEIYALRINGSPKAYPVDLVLRERVVNDELGGKPLVLIGNPASGAVRAYGRGEHRFEPGESPLRVVDETGAVWVVEEANLVAVGGTGAASSLERLPGHVAYWFGWYAFYPQTEVYAGS
jgi:hypothetical protein